ncbi:hypothetical protein EVAR_99272_1 [Eumeta japonica]|uniref:Uncharacterized protein n=1 Tax=Eumeta variegata TaxID=151549 RepID=A0A4C1ZB21_EUMVA|nr:hypothetical protein EVAR_99272_1 [Eumeta japonica]
MTAIVSDEKKDKTVTRDARSPRVHAALRNKQNREREYLTWSYTVTVRRRAVGRPSPPRGRLSAPPQRRAGSAGRGLKRDRRAPGDRSGSDNFQFK